MIRVGIVGTNTSHAGVYAGLLNGSDIDRRPVVAGAEVVAAWSSGRPGLSGMHTDAATLASGHRIAATVNDPAELIGGIDLALILDDFEGGSAHADLARPFLQAGIATYIDKPMCLAVSDAADLFAIAERSGAPLMSCSALRFADELSALRADKVGTVAQLTATGPGDWFNYGVHTVEAMMAIQGTGADTVHQHHGKNRDVTVIIGPSGPRAVINTERAVPTTFRLTAYGARATAGTDVSDADGFYANTIRAAVAMAETGTSPINPRETLEVLAILTAGRESAERGEPVRLADVLPGDRQ